MTTNAFVGAVGLLLCPAASAQITKFSGNFDPWAQAAGSYSTITFAEFGATPITTQYAPLGVNFTGSDLNNAYFSADNFPQDGWGLDGNSIIELTLDQPIHAMAWHFPATLFVNLWSGNQILYSDFFGDSSGQDFAGLYSEQTFDRVWLRGGVAEFDQVFLDNLYFSTIPAPGATGLLVMLGCLRRRRRRK